MGGSSGGTAVPIVVVVFFLILLGIFAELVYVMWYRKKFKTAQPHSGSNSEMAGADPYGTPDSKELMLYQVLCEGQRHHLRSERAPPVAENFHYSFPPAIGYAWSGPTSPLLWQKEEEKKKEDVGTEEEKKKEDVGTEEKRREEEALEEENEFEFVEVPVGEQTPFHTPWSSPPRLHLAC